MGPLVVELGPWLWLFVLHLAVEVLGSLLLSSQLLELLGWGQVFGHRGARREMVVGGRLKLPGGRSGLGWGQSRGRGGGRGDGGAGGVRRRPRGGGPDMGGAGTRVLFESH